MRLVKIAAVKKEELNEKLKAALEGHELARVAARVRRKDKDGKEAQKAPRSVAYLTSMDISSESSQAVFHVRGTPAQVLLPSNCAPPISEGHVGACFVVREPRTTAVGSFGGQRGAGIQAG